MGSQHKDPGSLPGQSKVDKLTSRQDYLWVVSLSLCNDSSCSCVTTLEVCDDISIFLFIFTVTEFSSLVEWRTEFFI
jgi:hypothetical protein